MVMIGGVILLIVSFVLWQFSIASNVTDNVFSTLLTYAPFVCMTMGAVMTIGGGLAWATNRS